MLPYAQLAPGSGFKLLRTLLYYSQRLFTGPVVRRAAAALIAAGVRRAQPQVARRPLEPDDIRALGALRSEGVALLSDLAPPETIEQMRAYFCRRPVIGPGGELRGLDELLGEARHAAYDMETVLGCPGLLSLVNSPAVLRVVEAYLGCKPTLSSLGVRWSFPGAGEEPGFQSFHRDVDDWRFLKLFIYLTDVCAQSGAHVYVCGSHSRGFGLRARVYRLSELETRYGADRVKTITGPAGTTFLADTVGIHRGGRPVRRPRLILQAQYSILPVYAFEYQPLALVGHDVDPYCNRLLLRRQGGGEEWAPEAATDAAVHF